MKKTAIFYFSGTGNTELIARGYAKALQRRGSCTDLFRMEDILHGRITANFKAYSLIGLGHPVYGFGASALAEGFASQLPGGEGTSAFVFKTASSPHYVNNSASNVIVRTMRNKGYEVFHNTLLAMPCNFYVKYDDRLNKQLYQAALDRLEVYADEILGGIPRTLEINRLLENLLKMVYRWEENKAGEYFAKGLRTTANCTMCLNCVKGCPVSNIAAGEDGMSFGPDCLLCMRCIYSCPQQAIIATKLRSSIVRPFNGGAKLKKLMEDSQNDGRFVTEHSKGYYKHFAGYMKGLQVPSVSKERKE